MIHYYLKYLCIVFCTAAITVLPLYAAENSQADTIIIINQTNELKKLLNHLLLESNGSSIQKIIKQGDEPIKALIADAFKYKDEGEKLLSEKKYMEAAVSFQISLNFVFKAIRQGGGPAEPADAIAFKLKEHFKVNDTFIATATRVVGTQQNQDALKLLQLAKEARNRAENESSDGKDEAALQELENSTHLAQQAIMKIRNGQVIERMQ